MTSIRTNRRRLIFLTLVTMISLSLLPALLHSVSLSPESSNNRYFQTAQWLSGWEYRKLHDIEGSAGAETNYQMRIQVDYHSGSDSGSTVHLDSHCNTDFSDIRFTDDDGSTQLDYWIERSTPGDYAVFWVEVKDNLDTSQEIYIYYGNDNAESESSGEDTFIFFDDFEDGSLDTGHKWAYEDGSVEEEGGRLVLKGTSETRGYIYSQIAVSSGAAFHARSRASNNDISGSRAFTATIGEALISTESCLDWDYMNDIYSVDSPNRILTRTRNRGNEDSKEVTVSDYTSYEEYRTLWTSEKTVYKQGETTIRTSTSQIPTRKQRFLFCEASQNGDDSYVDWVFIRKYIDSEPSHSWWGNEEIEGQATTTPGGNHIVGLKILLPVILGLPIVALVVVMVGFVYHEEYVIDRDSMSYITLPSLREKSGYEPPEDPQHERE
ncbi:MAG: DUF2341 domain-containing protein [Candidatus Thorarchaeota archaeon]|nr:DUF2341 domain-containing protein [Candidatus Thorarchaeota archaeon]